MNNFTKEELEHILYCVCIEPLDDLILVNKIKSMIDNYCEHDWREGMCQICDKCEAIKEY